MVVAQELEELYAYLEHKHGRALRLAAKAERQGREPAMRAHEARAAAIGRWLVALREVKAGGGS